MARCPFATWKPLPANDRQAHMTPRLAIVHTAVDAPGPTDLYGWFVQSGLESHFFVHSDGAIHQYMDTGVVAEANYRANQFAASIETEDEGRPEQTPWNSAQFAAIVRLLDWLCTTHAIPRRKADRWDGSGLGWHSMWGLNTKAQPNINPWTTALGKSCPGTPRIQQMRDQIIPRLAGPIQENDMDATEHSWLETVYVEMTQKLGIPETGYTDTIAGLARNAARDSFAARAGIGALNVKVDSLTGGLSARDAEILAAIRAADQGDAEAIAQHLAPLLPAPQVVVHLPDAELAAFATAAADEIDRRARDNNPTTGPTT